VLVAERGPEVLELAALERQARERLDVAAYDYFAGGAEDELTLAANPAAWARLRLRPHVLRDVGTVSTSTTVLGAPVGLPVLVGPIVWGLATGGATGVERVLNGYREELARSLALCGTPTLADLTPDLVVTPAR
jgi:isopentenyl diphosphate isomerase/L-lactate dehydrogenase-like FMN-dependent dehydrogenase